VAVSASTVEAAPIARFIEVTGTLTAQESADVAAEIAGRIEATPVERGSGVGAGAALVRIAATEVEAQAREAEADASQIEARLGLAGGGPFTVTRVPEVASAQAARALARADFERARTLHAAKLIAQAEFLTSARSSNRPSEHA
jgi:multidrug efflux pump subunit AcrA (membrane-fusion protein)